MDSRFHIPNSLGPAAFGLVAVGAVVNAGTRQVFPQSVAVMPQVRVEADVEAVPVVDGVEPGLEGVPQFLVVWLAHEAPSGWVSLFQQGGHVFDESADVSNYLVSVHYG